MRPLSLLLIRIVRWWFGLTYFVAGLGALIAGPVMSGLGNSGGIEMLIGGPFILALGWVVHPWGLQRAMHGQPLLPLRR
jgi:hypothetical protein